MKIKLALITLLSAAILILCAAQRGEQAILTQTVASGASPVFVESIGATTNGSTNVVSITFGTNTTSSNEDIGVVIWDQGTSTNCATSGTATLTDSGVQSYTFLWGIQPNHVALGCFQLFHKSSSASGISSVTVTLAVGHNLGGAIAWHVKNIATGNDSGTTAAPSTTGQAAPWASSSETSASTEFMAALTLTLLNTSSGGGNNAQLFNGSWTTGYMICSQSSSAPCSVQGAFLDGANGDVLGMAYQVVAPSSLAGTGTNNGSTNTYYNYPGIAGWK